MQYRIICSSNIGGTSNGASHARVPRCSRFRIGRCNRYHSATAPDGIDMVLPIRLWSVRHIFASRARYGLRDEVRRGHIGPFALRGGTQNHSDLCHSDLFGRRLKGTRGPTYFPRSGTLSFFDRCTLFGNSIVRSWTTTAWWAFIISWKNLIMALPDHSTVIHSIGGARTTNYEQSMILYTRPRRPPIQLSPFDRGE